jgi:hypothetical protein
MKTPLLLFVALALFTGLAQPIARCQVQCGRHGHLAPPSLTLEIGFQIGG